MNISSFFRLLILPLLSFIFCGAAVANVSFRSLFYYPTGSWPEAVVIADINNDGRNDVVLNTSTYMGSEEDFKLKVFLQDEFGQLQAPVNYSINGSYTNRPRSIASGDLNGDGLQDLAVGVDRSHIEVFLQYIDGTLFRADTITTQLSTRIAIGDLDGDDLDDIAGISWGGNEVGIFYQGEQGISHQPEAHYAPHGGYDDMVLGDINGDDANDIVVMSGQLSLDNLAVVASDGQGGLRPVAFYDLDDLGLYERTLGVTIGDMNGDGRSDVAATYGGSRPTSVVAVFHQQEDGLLNSPVLLESYHNPQTIHAADLNRDAKDDLLVLHGGWDNLGVYEQASSGILIDEILFGLPYASSSSYNPQGMDVGDINGDGTPDVVVAAHNYGLQVLLGAETEPTYAPIADAGNNQVVAGNLLVQLDGSNSTDSDGSIVDYRWRQLSGTSVSLNDSGDGYASFIAPGPALGESLNLVFELEVEDNDGLKARDTITVMVEGNIEGNTAPIAVAGAGQTVKQNSIVELNGTESVDTDGSIANYQWVQVSGPGVSLANADAAIASFATPKLKGLKQVQLVFELAVTDNLGEVSTDQVVITVVK